MYSEWMQFVSKISRISGDKPLAAITYHFKAGVCETYHSVKTKVSE